MQLKKNKKKSIVSNLYISQPQLDLLEEGEGGAGVLGQVPHKHLLPVLHGLGAQNLGGATSS